MLVSKPQSRPEEHAKFESLSRNRISNVSFALSSIGEAIMLVIMIGILEGMKAGDSVENNTKAYSAMIAFSGGVWCKWSKKYDMVLS